MFCTYCGKEIAEGALFCTSCGNRVVNANSTQEKTAVNESDISSNELEETVLKDEAAESVFVDASNKSIEPEDSAQPEQQAVEEIRVTPVAMPNPTAAQNSQADVPAAKKPIVLASDSQKKSLSSGIVLVFIAVAVIVAVFLLFSKGSGYEDYKSLVNDYYKAIYKEDFNLLLKLYDKDIQKDMKEYKDDIKDELEDLKDDFDDEFDNGWLKKVEVKSRRSNGKDDGIYYYTVQVEIDEEPQLIGVKRIDGKYYIDEEHDYIDD